MGSGIRTVTVLVFFVTRLTQGLQPHDSCTDVKTFYEDKGFSQLVLHSAKADQQLNVCGGDVSCCTPGTEDRLSVLSMDDIRMAVANRSALLVNLLSKKHERFDTFFKELIESAKKSLDSLFDETYGDLYTNNAKVFMKFFEDLRLYYDGGIVDLTDIFDSFFTTTMQRVFKLLNLSYDIDDEYLQCIGDNLNVIRPFADLPQKLSNKVQRSFIAARTFVQALKNGERVVVQLGKIYPTTTCIKEYMKAMHCSKCSGFVDAKPCKNTCEQVLGECMCGVSGDVNDAWNKYLDEMMAVLNRLVGPFDIESVLFHIDVQISEGIMMLQDNKRAITTAVIQQCGEMPKNTNMSVFGNPLGPFDFSGLSTDMSQNSNTNPFAGLDLSGLARDLSKNSKSPLGSKNPLGGLDLSGLSFDFSKKSTNDGSNPLNDFDLSRLPSFGRKGLDGLEFDEVDDSPRRTKRSSASEDDSVGRRRRKRRRKNKRNHRVRDVSGSKKKQHQRKTVPKHDRGTHLKDLVGEMRLARKDIKNFWREFPQQLCIEGTVNTPGKSCWDGTGMKIYVAENTDDTRGNRRCGNATISLSAATRQQIVVLREVASKLLHAHNGIDPTFLDHETPGYFSGEGSGEEDNDGEATEEIVTQAPKSKRNKKGKLVKDLKEWQVELIEHALGKSIDKKAKLKDVKVDLVKHPHIQMDKTIPIKPENDQYGNLTKTQQRQLKKILGMPHEPQIRNEDPPATTPKMGVKEPKVTQKSRGVETTTSGARGVQLSSIGLLTVMFLMQFIGTG